jgi:hypothetical protein
MARLICYLSNAVRRTGVDLPRSKYLVCDRLGNEQGRTKNACLERLLRMGPLISLFTSPYSWALCQGSQQALRKLYTIIL